MKISGFTSLRNADRKRLFQTWWIEHFGDWLIGRGSYRLVRP